MTTSFTGILIATQGRRPFHPFLSSVSSHPIVKSPREATSVRCGSFGGFDGGAFHSLVKIQLNCHNPESQSCAEHCGMNRTGSKNKLFGLQVSQFNMSVSTLSTQSSLAVSENVTDLQDVSRRELISLDEQSRVVREPRKVCIKCWKPASRCICDYIKVIVKNKTTVTILQHPEERKHHLGSARIALLGLQSVELITIPEIDEGKSHRTRPKVQGSKRCQASRGGKKAALLQEIDAKSKALDEGQKLPNGPGFRQSASERFQPSTSAAIRGAFLGEANGFVNSSGVDQGVLWTTVPPWINLRPDAGLLFPSSKALDFGPVGLQLSSSSKSKSLQSKQGTESNLEGEQEPPISRPSQLIVLDGTWSKARRIFFQNPWLNLLPHYKLPTLQPSRYGSLRPEPKPGFLSTVESIVYALQLLEPETEDLHSLLDAFDCLISDQVKCLANPNKLDRGRPLIREFPLD